MARDAILVREVNVARADSNPFHLPRAPVPRRLETRLPEAERSSQSTEGLKSIGRPNRECQAPICKDLAVVRAQ